MAGMPEAVDHPAHYGGADNPYEAIKVIEAWKLGFHLGNTVKYISRAGQKGDALEDLRKAAWYLNREIERQTPATTDAEAAPSRKVTLSFRKDGHFDCWAESAMMFENIRLVANRAADGLNISTYALYNSHGAPIPSSVTVKSALELNPDGTFVLEEL